MDVDPPPDDTFLTIYWTRRDVLIQLARRLPESEGRDTFDLIVAGEPLTPERVGVTVSQLDNLEDAIESVLEDMSVARGWEIIEEALSYHLGYPDERIARGEHPNAPLPD